jgi:hypothetical protein
MEVFQLRVDAPGILEMTASTSTGGAEAAATAGAAGAAGGPACAGVDADVSTAAGAAGAEATTAGCDGGKILARMLLKRLTEFSNGL